MTVCHEYVQSENLFSEHFSRRLPITIGLRNDWSSRPPIFLAEQFQIHLVDERCITYAVSPHAPTYPAVEELRPEDDLSRPFPNPSRSRPAGSAYNTPLQPETSSDHCAGHYHVYSSTCSSPQSILVPDGRPAWQESSRQVETPFLVH
jgi:hypothetical protein